MQKDYTKSDREIGEAWELYNAAFRAGFAAGREMKVNDGDPKGTPWQRGFNGGWEWGMSGRECPEDPMWTVLGCDRLFE